jgi:hypothetical protein
MNIYRNMNSPLSFRTNDIIVQPINEWQFEVIVDGKGVGYIITRQNDWGIDIKDYPFTKEDEKLLIDAAKSVYQLNKEQQKTPQEASELFYKIMKASVSHKATGAVEKKDKPKVKPKPKK